MLDVFDHVTLRVGDIEASRRCYELALGELGYGEPYSGAAVLRVGGPVDLGERATIARRHATSTSRSSPSSREQVAAWWSAMTAAGHPGRRRARPAAQYSPDYYGAFVRDPDGNSLEAVHVSGQPRGGENRLDHLWIRVRDLAESRLFYETVAPTSAYASRTATPAASTSRARRACSRSSRASR